jgi:hypothetical protein
MFADADRADVAIDDDIFMVLAESVAATSVDLLGLAGYGPR